MKPLPRIIGLGYRAQSGKDTVADFLAARYGYKRTAFAAPLKEACASVFGFTHEQLHGRDKELPDSYWSRVLGKPVTPRWVLQHVGTELFRQNLHPDIWVHALGKKVCDGGLWAVSDVRFPNEADAIKSWGGQVWRLDRVCRCAIGGSTTHESETAMATYTGWDATIPNHGTIRELYLMVNGLLADMSG